MPPAGRLPRRDVDDYGGEGRRGIEILKLFGGGLPVDQRGGFAHEGVGHDPLAPLRTDIPAFQFGQFGFNDLPASGQGGARSVRLFQLLLGHGQRRASLGGAARVLSAAGQSSAGPVRGPGIMALAVLRQAQG